MPTTIYNNNAQPVQLYRRGLGLKKEVEGLLDQEYSSRIVEYFREHDFRLQLGDLTVLLAKEFGFCYGVDRAIDYAYQTRKKFPDKRIFLTGELIHNPFVNKKMLEMGIGFLSGQYAGENKFDILQADDVVILPAFGVTHKELEFLKARGCILVDTTCGSVLNVWKRVERYAKNGFTSLIHGKYSHEETRATCSQATKYEGAHYIVVLDMEETELVCDFIAGRMSKEAFLQRFEKAISPGFDPDLHLQKIGCANQTTMLSNESLAIAERIGKELEKKLGPEKLAEHFMSFDTICSATQERQDAVLELVQNNAVDVMLIIGGYNSSNTGHLAELAEEYTAAYHIDDAACLLSRDEIRYQPVFTREQVLKKGWLSSGTRVVGITAGASTPNNKIGTVVARLAELYDVSLDAALNGRR